MFAPSQYINAPFSFARSFILDKFSSYNPKVFGFVIITTATSGPIAFLNSLMSMFPRSSVGIVTVWNLHIAAVAGFVP